MKFLSYTILIIIIIIDYIESCMRLWSCTWKDDPCLQYNDINNCFNHTECKWGNLEEPPQSPVNVKVEFGNGVNVGAEFNNNDPNPNQGGNPIDPNMNQACNGRNYTPCSFSCEIF